jgi:hypothetical protein
MVVLVGEEDGKQHEVCAKLIELTLGPNAGEELLKHDARERYWLVLVDQFLEHDGGGTRITGRRLGRPAEGARPDGSVDDDHLDTRAFL